MHTSVSSLVRPEEQERLDAVLQYREKYRERDHFKNWLERQSDTSLKDLHEPTSSSAQNFLYSQDSDITSPIPDHLISVAVAMIERWGWDVHLQGLFCDDSRNSRTVYEDETFLEWLTVFGNRNGSSLPGDLQWPTTPEDFLHFDTLHSPIRNHEWLIALTVSHGANPWTMKREERRHGALQNCLLRAHPKIAVQLLSLPGAPTLREVLDEPRCYNDDRTTMSKLLLPRTRYERSRSFRNQQLTTVLNAFPDTPLNLEELAVCSIDILRVNLTHRNDLTEESHQTLSCLMVEKTNEYFWRTEELVSRLHLLPQNRAWSARRLLEEHALQTNQFLLNPGLDGGLHLCNTRIEQSPETTSWLCQSTPVTGPLHGHWSVFNAHVCAVVLRGEENGCRELPWDNWLSKSEKEGENSAISFSPDLAQLIHQDLGNGLPTRGLWVLAFLGKGLGKEKNNWLNVESKVLGISDWTDFFVQGRKAAVDATLWLLTHVSDDDKKQARKALLNVWRRCLHNLPTWMNDHPAHLASVLRVLSVDQYLLWENLSRWPSIDFDPWASMLCFLQKNHSLKTEGENSDFFINRTPEEQHLSMEILLNSHHPMDVEEACEWLEEAPSIPDGMNERIMDWMGHQKALPQNILSHEKYFITQEHLSRLRAATMKHRLPHVSSDTPTARL